MRVKAIDGREAAGVRLLTFVVEHADPEALPAGGWVSEASAGRLMDAEGGVWFVAEGGQGVTRLKYLSCGCACPELTTYQDGAEIFREVAPTS
ncbi:MULTISPECIES: hypothetical protein [unclassified Streptomyces]|uniref:hypothetical protein n=1 Tax=unclassified Streptomyces TaxID=2593676 RepID=UPI00324B0347